MFKGFTTEVAKEVGKSGAILLNQLLQWFKSQSTVKIYRTNEELVEDLCGIISTATVQRSKEALIKHGYITISFDKGYKRTTHYQLTEKAKALLVDGRQEKAPVKVKPSEKPKAPVVKAVPNQNQPIAASKSMQESFNAGNANPNSIPCPTDLKSLLKGSATPVSEVQDTQPEIVYKDDSHLFPKKEDWSENPDDMSDEEYFKAIDSALTAVYNKIPNVEVLNERLLDPTHKHFKEDF
jgi:DNA-binding MarR family transcriptional regulator